MDSKPKILACCGLDCSSCPTIEATKQNDKEYFESVAKSIGQRFDKTINPDDLHCEGCMTAGCKSKYTMSCSIRRCNHKKGIANCAHCDEYLCEKMHEFLLKCPKELEQNLVQERHEITKI